jgi:hypothetical protein
VQSKYKRGKEGKEGGERREKGRGGTHGAMDQHSDECKVSTKGRKEKEVGERRAEEGERERKERRRDPSRKGSTERLGEGEGGRRGKRLTVPKLQV